MRKAKPLTNGAGEVRELTAAEFKQMRPYTKQELEGLRAPHTIRHVTNAQYETVKRKVGERGPQKAPTKRLVSLRLSAGVLEHFKSTGAGWQTRIDETLKRAAKRAAG